MHGAKDVSWRGGGARRVVAVLCTAPPTAGGLPLVAGPNHSATPPWIQSRRCTAQRTYRGAAAVPAALSPCCARRRLLPGVYRWWPAQTTWPLLRGFSLDDARRKGRIVARRRCPPRCRRAVHGAAYCRGFTAGGRPKPLGHSSVDSV